MSSPRRERLLIAVALIAIPLVYFYPVLTGQVTLAPGDGWAQNLGVRSLAGQMIARGEWPLWNPFIFGGMPLAASVYPGSFYPPNWLFALLAPVTAINLVVLTTYHLALIGTYLYARRAGLTRLGAILAGTAFAFGGFMINHLSHTSRIAAAAWLPWVLLAIENLAVKEDWQSIWRWTVLGALMVALQFFAGEPQMMVFSALTAAPCVIFAFVRIRDGRSRTRFVVSLALMLLGAILLSMIQLLPSLELLAQSERSDPGPAFFDTYSLPPWQLPGLIFPYFFGGALLPPYRIGYWGAEIAAIMSGYAGMLIWILALTAVWGASRPAFTSGDAEIGLLRLRVWLWLGVAILSLVLAFGGHLPFELNHLLYRLPGYKTFRGLYRHQFEFTFAMGMLGGLGMTFLERLKSGAARRLLWGGTIAMSSIVLIVIVLYRCFGERMATVIPRPAGADALTNPEFIFPAACFVLSLAAIWFAQSRHLKSRIRYILPVGVLLLDLASYGHFFHWRIATFDAGQRLADPPAVRLIKSRERDLNSFRVMSHPVQAYDYSYAWPEDPNFDLLNQPNVSMLRGLQSVSGYDILRPVRVGQITGSAGSAINGFVQDADSFGLSDRGLDLLGVKYLIVGHGQATGKRVGFTHDGVYFARTNFGVEFKPGMKLTTMADGASATEIAIVSTAANSTHLTDGAPILMLKLHARDGRVIETVLQVGRDTSEWAYDRADVRSNVRHRRARIVESAKAGDFESHFYLGRLNFDRAEIEKVEWIYAREDASLYLIRASLHDQASGISTPLANFYLPPERWTKLARFDQVEVYENRNALPRAWFVDRVVVQNDDQNLKAIRAGLMPDGSPFDPQKTALLDRGQIDPERLNGQDLHGAEVRIRYYQPLRIELETDRPREGLLVLSEVFDEGWKALIDGRPAEIERANYTLRGITVPAGAHRVELVYQPRSFRMGESWFVLGLILLLGIGPLICYRMRSRTA